jgi:DNA-binding IclR family transcriptional regulator
MTEGKSDTSGEIKSDQTLLSIIEGLQRLEESGITELADDIGLSKSTVHKHLKTLESNGYVVNSNGNYRLAFRFLTLGGVVRNNSQLCAVSYEPVREFAEKTDMMTTFAMCEHNRGYFTHDVNNKYGMSVVTIGSEFYLHQNAAGKAMLAELPDKTIERIVAETGLPAKTENTITDPAELFKEIHEIRAQGYALSVSERVEGVQSLSAAIENPETDELGAISITAPAAKTTSSQIEDKYAEKITDTAVEIGLKLRYQ